MTRKHQDSPERLDGVLEADSKQLSGPLGEMLRRDSDLEDTFTELPAVSLGVVRELVTKADEEKRSTVERIVGKLLKRTDSESIFLQLEIAFYFDNIGDALKAVIIAQKAVDLCQELGDVNLLRKAHNTAGILYSRTCDFELACFHLERALTLARRLNNECFEFAALCNVVSTLQVMGLVNEAKSLSVRLSKRPSGTPEVDYLHLQNALNGLRLAGYARDTEAASYFNEIARDKLRSAGAVSSNWKAYIDSYYALSLVQQGKSELAYSVISEAIRQRVEFENPRITAILYCALGSCALAANDRLTVKESIQVLVGLLETSKSYALDHEDVLRTLVKLYEVDQSRLGQQTGLAYLRKLNNHLVNVKHKQFFGRIRSGASGAAALQERICRPAYSLPTNLATAALECEDYQTRSPPCLYASSNDHVQGKQLRFLETSRQKLEAPFRSEDFNIAEDWAVAADFAAERPDGHCFIVASLSKYLGLRLGFSPERSMLIEMACRLHDIGKLAVDAETHRLVNSGLRDSYLSIMEHSYVGAKLLASSSDSVLQLASSIARHHHEWWNGCGLPDRLAGELIPLEARICAIADAYAVCVNPSAPQVAWDKHTAIQQVVSMAGVQLDPALVAPFLLAVEDFIAQTSVNDSNDSPFLSNSLIIAKQHLLNAVNLAP